MIREVLQLRCIVLRLSLLLLLLLGRLLECLQDVHLDLNFVELLRRKSALLEY